MMRAPKFIGLLFSSLALSLAIASADPLVGIDQFVTTSSQNQVVIPMQATGGNGGSYTFSYPSQQTVGSFVQTGPEELTYTPNATFSGVDTAFYEVTDGVNLRSAIVVVAVNIPANAFTTNCYIFHPALGQWVLIGTQQGLGVFTVNWDPSSIVPPLNSGNYQFRWEVVLGGQVVAQGGPNNHVVDMLAPVVTWINHPGIGGPIACKSNDIQFEISAVDDLAVAPNAHLQTPQYINPGIPPTNFDFIPTSTFQDYIEPAYQTTQLLDGVRRFRAFAVDVPGNRSDEIFFDVNVDNTNPTNLQLDFTPSLTIPVIRGGRTVNFSASDNNCGIGQLDVVVESAVNTTIGTNLNQSSLAAFWNTLNFADGFYTVRGVARDRAGNQSSAQSILIRIDNSSPTILSIGLPTSVTTSGATINWSTDETATSQVEYGVTTAYGNSTALNSSLLMSHSEPLAGLQANTVYHYRVKSQDEAGNLTISADQTFQTVPLPSVTITAPSGVNPVAGANVTVSASASVNTVGVQFQLDGSNLGAEDTSVPYAINWNTLVVSNGSHVLRAVARDAANNLVPSPVVNVTVDNAAPVISALNAINLTMNGATILWTTNEPADSRVEYGLTTAYGNLTTLNSALSTAHSEAIIGLTPNTLYHFRVISRDGVGNSATSADGTFSTNALPTISISAPVNNARVGGANVQVSATASANVSSVQFKFNNTNIGPVISGASPFTFQWNTSALTLLTSNLVVEGNFGGPSPVVSSPITLTVDNQGPVITNTGASNITATVATINWNTDETATSQVEYGFTTAYGNSTTENTTLMTSHSESLSALLPSTLYHARVKSRDSLGNLSTSSDFTFTTDALPTISITAPQNGAIVRGNNVQVAAQVSVTPLGVQFTVDGNPMGAEIVTPPYQATWDTGLFNGNRTLRAVARYGTNTVTSNPVNVTVDNIVPTISNFLPLDNATVSGLVVLEFSAQDNAGLDVLQIWVNGVLIHSKQSAGATSDSIQFSFNSVAIPNNSYTVTARALDRAGNDVLDTHTIHVQNAAGTVTPVVTILSPVEGAFVKGFLNNGSIRARITNNPVPSSVVMRIDNGSPITPVSVNGDVYEFNWNTLTSADGLHTLGISASNSSGSGADDVQVDVDNTLPVINWVEPAANQQLFYDVNLVANVADGNRASVNEVKFYFNTPANEIAVFVNPPVGLVSRIIDTRVYNNTNYSLFAVATDRAGNVSAPALVPVFVDNINIPISQGSLTLHPASDAFVTNAEDAQIRVTPQNVTINLASITPASFEVDAIVNGETRRLQGSALFQNGSVLFTGEVPQNSRVTVRARFLDSTNQLLESSWSFVYGSDHTQPISVTSIKDGVRVTVNVPANALSKDAILEILPIELNQMPQAMMEANQVPSGIPNLEMWKLPYLITAKDAMDNEVLLDRGETASFVFEDQIPDPVQKFVFRVQALDEQNKQWKLLGGNGLMGASDAPVAKTITAAISSFGYFRAVNFPAATSGISELFNFPNPFSPRDGGTTLSYLLSEDSEVTLVLYDLLGNLVKKMNISQGSVGGAAGINNVRWDGRNGEGMEVANGGYLLQVLAKGASGTTYKERHKVAVLK